MAKKIVHVTMLESFLTLPVVKINYDPMLSSRLNGGLHIKDYSRCAYTLK
jgi:hypothetical protein